MNEGERRGVLADIQEGNIQEEDSQAHCVKSIVLKRFCKDRRLARGGESDPVTLSISTQSWDLKSQRQARKWSSS
ncbi:hypothetical protein [Ignatzschineria indica]|uniref:hypothetical protein n=1 Tax=Ignatzschineria indica TaxID=472583 RepID=UPI0036294296